MIKIGKSAVFVVLAALMLGGCSSKPEPATVGDVDLQRYQGTWYEIARLPLFFQRKCAQSEANYRLLEDGSVALINRCQTVDGTALEVSGRAVAQLGRTDRLWVNFDNWFSNLFPSLTRGDYWILDLDEQYQVVLVGTPDRKYLWLLAREPQIPQETLDRLLAVAQQQGYDTRELIWREQRISE